MKQEKFLRKKLRYERRDEERIPFSVTTLVDRNTKGKAVTEKLLQEEGTSEVVFLCTVLACCQDIMDVIKIATTTITNDLK